MPRLPIAQKVAENTRTASWIREMFEVGRRLKAEKGEENVFDLSLGNPNATPPQRFFDALREVAAEKQPDLHRYMPNSGFDETREAVAAFLSREYRMPIDRGGVIMTSGAAGGLNVVMRAICDPGDEIICLTPYFPEYKPYIEHAGGVVRLVPTDEQFQPDLDAIEAAINERTRGILINSPSNPSGAVYSEQVCRGLADMLQLHDDDARPIYLVVDDPYRRVIYDLDWCPTPVRHYPRSIIVSSYSKDLSIPGERAGYIAIPPTTPERATLLGAITMLNRTMGFVNMSAFMQRVIARCADALCDQSLYRENRALLCAGLRDAGYELVTPRGALYAFPRTPIPDDVAFVKALLRYNVLAVPGAGFGCPGHIRLSFCVDRHTVEGALPGLAAAAHDVAAGV